MTENAGGRNWERALTITATVLIIVVCVAMLFRIVFPSRVPIVRSSAAAQRTGPPEPPLPRAPLALDGAALKGSVSADIGMIEYGDFQCPFCAKFARDILPALDQKYITTGKILFAFRVFPLESIHPLALKAAEEADCAGRQGRFWPVHDALFGNSARLTSDYLDGIPARLHLDPDELKACAADDALRRVQANEASAKDLLVSGTPTFFLGKLSKGSLQVSRRLTGAQPLQQFESAIDILLKSR